MARRKRRTASKKRAGSKIALEIKSSVLREIWAVVHLSIGFFTLLSLNHNFGVVGDIWMEVLSPVLGWGIHALPYLFFALSFMLFFSRKVSFPLSRILGMFFMAVSVLSILHLSVPMESIYSEAQAGNYGGYIGFVTNFLFRELLNIGQLGATVVYFALLLIGVLLTFQIPLSTFIAFLKPQITIVRKKERNLKTVPQEDVREEEEESGEKEYDLDELDEDAEPTEADLERERFQMARDGEDQIEMLTIKRPVTQKTESEPTKRRIEIKDDDVQDEAAGSSEEVNQPDEDYVWSPPSLDLLSPAEADVELDDESLKVNAKKIREKLKQFGIEVDMHEVHVGPTVIQYTLRPDEGIKLSKITGLKNDLALALAAKAIRIEAPIPGKSLVGIEVPNDRRTNVHLRELLESKEYSEVKSNLRLPLGRDVAGKPICANLATMPHLLVAGATGSGKSVGMNAFLLSLLYQNSPYDLKLIMIDPKRVELGTYNGIPHLLTPVVTDPEKAAIALRWAVAEMNRRYQLCAENDHRNLEEFNSCAEVHEKGSETPGHVKMPNIVIVIDELADLMMAAGKEVEASICRVAQMARAVGMHLIVATQRPSVDVITGLIKANIPTRISFAVSSSIDSRTILDGTGAEDLLGKGDMLYLPGGMSKPLRVQGIYVSSKEIERVTNVIKISAPPNYVDDIISPRTAQQKIQGIPESDLGDGDDDSLYQQAVGVVVESHKASASLLQRRLKVGYARAARLLDLMEQNGIIGPVNGAKAREIYVE